MRRLYSIIMINMILIYSFLNLHSSCLEFVTEDVKDFYPQVDARYAICIDTENQKILYYKNPFDRVPIASTTKIMTAIVALENADINAVYSVSKNAAATQGSRMGLKTGEKLALNELMYGLMLESGNDAAVAIAESVAGTVPNFAELMNKTAKTLGLKDTNFVNPHGLDVNGHYSSAYDMALITNYALLNPNFRKIVNCSQIYIAGRNLTNTNPFLLSYQGVDGVKTGYTAGAGKCLVISANNKNYKIITVILNSSSSNKRIESGKKIMDYVFSNFDKYPINVLNQTLAFVPVIKGTSITATGLAQKKMNMVLNKKEKENLITKVEMKENLYAPIAKGEEIGVVTYQVSGEVLLQVPIINKMDIAKKNVWNYFFELFNLWIKDLL